ncbi:MAG TPA: CPBP family intramembrane glutamic endopeptidase [Actinomycetota bacterium]|nr:CPBP family intramembrane glutamic endopeptidase [Actinomycetota bacterium]
MRAEAPSAERVRTLREEILIVLSLSFLASAVYAVLSLLEAPIRGETVASVPQDPSLVRQLVGIAFGLAPVWLVLHLLRRGGEGPAAIGLRTDRPGEDAARGLVLAAVVGAAGAGLYLAAVALGVNRAVVPVPPLGHWWTWLVLVLRAAEAALTEEIVVLAYLVSRLQRIGWGPWAAVGGSALLRGAYHLYQGWGGFAGNLALGLLFGAGFLRTRRAGPFVVAHFALDVAAGVAFVVLRGRLGV